MPFILPIPRAPFIDWQALKRPITFIARLPLSKILIFCISAFLLLVIGDWFLGVIESSRERLALLESQMAEKIRPVVHGKYVTVIQAKDEIIIETIEGSE